MDSLLFGLSVAAMGMLVVFSGLIILIVCIKGITALSAKGGAKKAAPKTADENDRVPAPAPVATAAVAPVSGVPAEIVAAITAAIAAVWDGKGGFTVRHVRRVGSPSAWNRAGREDQIYSRF